jgi:CheY-like chemotaxis protein
MDYIDVTPGRNTGLSMKDHEIEAVARAFFEVSSGQDPGWEHQDDEIKEQFRAYARLAASAIDHEEIRSEAQTTVLVVEDDDAILDMVTSRLKRAGFTVISARTGEEALTFLSLGTQIDVLFTDIRMPGKVDGWEVAQIFRQKLPQVQVIYGTGYAENSNPVPGSKVLHKPYRMSQVIRTIAFDGQSDTIAP